MASDDDIIWMENDVPYSQRFGDRFYSRTDGRIECDHVYLRGNSVQNRWAQSPSFSIGELGFGTGLNLLETWRQWIELRTQGQTLSFTSFELYPLAPHEIRRAAAQWPILAQLVDVLTAHWDTAIEGAKIMLDPQTSFRLVAGDVREKLPLWSGKADAWFLDGFAPARNPQMWEADLLRVLVEKTNHGGTFATFTAASQVRRNLGAAGFDVQKCVGYAGKRDMMKGVLRPRCNPVA